MKVQIIFRYDGPVLVNDKLMVKRFRDKVKAKDKASAAKALKEKIIHDNNLPKKARVFLPAPFIELERVM